MCCQSLASSRSSESRDKLPVCLFLHGKTRCSVPSEDCGPRREGAAAPTGRAGRVVQEVAAAAAPSPGRLHASPPRPRRLARHPRRVARWRETSPCQPPSRRAARLAVIACALLATGCVGKTANSTAASMPSTASTTTTPASTTTTIDTAPDRRRGRLARGDRQAAQQGRQDHDGLVNQLDGGKDGRARNQLRGCSRGLARLDSPSFERSIS